MFMEMEFRTKLQFSIFLPDMYADAVLCAVLQAESMDTPSYVPTTASSMKVDKMHFKVI